MTYHFAVMNLLFLQGFSKGWQYAGKVIRDLLFEFKYSGGRTEEILFLYQCYDGLS